MGPLAMGFDLLPWNVTLAIKTASAESIENNNNHNNNNYYYYYYYYNNDHRQYTMFCYHCDPDSDLKVMGAKT